MSITDIFSAAKEGAVADVQHFVEKKGVDVNEKDTNDWTPLHFAAYHNSNVEVIKYLVSQGADINARSNSGRTPIYGAAQNNTNVEILKYLVSQGTDVNARDNKGFAPLHVVSCETAKNAHILISKGADIHTKEAGGGTPLHVASISGNIELVKILISAGADVNAESEGGATPLGAAAFAGNVEVLVYLVSQRADINAKQTDNGDTPLHNAAYHNPNVEVLKYLVSQGADVNTKCNDGSTPLHHAAHNPNVEEMLKYLVSQGAVVDANDIRVRVMLDAAIEIGNEKLVSTLISTGIDVNAKNAHGLTPFELAKAKGNATIVQHLLSCIHPEERERYLAQKKEDYERKCQEIEECEQRRGKERREKKEQEHRETEQAKQRKRQKKLDKTKGRRYKVGRTMALLLATLAVSMGFTIENLCPYSSLSVLTFFLLAIYTIPFLVIFFSGKSSKGRRIVFLIVSIFLNLWLFSTYSSSLCCAAEIYIGSAMCISHLMACILAMAFPKNIANGSTRTNMARVALSIVTLVAAIIININLTGGLTPRQISVPSAVYATVTTYVLNVRTGPSTGHNIQDSLSENTRVEIIEMVTDPWVRIRYGDGRIGYVNGNFLSE